MRGREKKEAEGRKEGSEEGRKGGREGEREGWGGKGRERKRKGK